MGLPNDLAWKQQLYSHQAWLKTMLRARVGSHDAEDLLQEIFADALAVDASKVSETAPWLYRIAMRKVLLHRRSCGRNRRKNRCYVNDVACNRDAQLDDPLRLLLGAEHTAQIQLAFAKLDGQDREILLLKYEHGWSYAQIGKHLGIGRGKVTHRLRRARGRLRNVLMPRDES